MAKTLQEILNPEIVLSFIDKEQKEGRLLKKISYAPLVDSNGETARQRCDRVLRENIDIIVKAIKWRGWDKGCHCHACDAIRELVKILSDNRVEMEEYC